MAKQMIYYAVQRGFTPGIYATWAECEKQVKGYSGAIFKKFTSLEDAKIFMQGSIGTDVKAGEQPVIDTSKPYAFVDGSFNAKKGLYGYGAIFFDGEKETVLSGSENKEDSAALRNIAGELLGTLSVVSYAIGKVKNLALYYDYAGIEMWATDRWEAKNEITQHYKQVMKRYMKLIDIEFIHIKGHSGVALNEKVDKIAKKAVGL